MASQTPDQIAANWANRLGSSSDKIKAGIQAVSVAPGVAAARQKAVYAQNTAAAVDKWAARSAAVPLATWQDAAINKGVQRIGTGAQAAQGKFSQFMGELLPHIDRTKAALQPRGNLDQNLNRMVAFARGMSTFKRTGS
jgi:hypothetical protein